MTADQAWAALRAVDRRQALFTGLGALAGLLLAGLVALALAAAWLYPQLPPLDKVTDNQPRQPLQIVTSDGVEIAQFGTERRHYLPIAEIPRQMQEALLAVEDTRFREHGGIDPRGIARAVFAMLTGGMRQGASTITQQVARTFFLSSRLSPESCCCSRLASSLSVLLAPSPSALPKFRVSSALGSMSSLPSFR